MSIRNETNNAPKTIWILWLQGIDSAPQIVKACVASWRRMNPNWTVQILARTNLVGFLPDVDDPNSVLSMSLSDATYSDILRIELLCRYGGVWVDATCYCLKPLDEWLYDLMSEGFFAFERPAPTRMLSSWFLAAVQSSYLTHQWRRLVHQHWQNRADDPDYFWFHHLFGEAYQEDKKFRALWDRVPKISAEGAHIFAPYETRFLGAISDEDRDIVSLAKLPVLKLTHKVDHGAVIEGSVYQFLCNFGERSSAKNIQRPHNRYTGLADTEAKARPILLCWYGSLKDNGTIGDLYAVQSVAARMKASGFNFRHLTASAAFEISGERVALEELDYCDYATLVFVCGPVIKDHPIVETVIRRFPSVRKIGVSVSLFDRNHINYVQPFDVVLAREGGGQRFEDVAILAPSRVTPKRMRGPNEQLVVGLVLRGEQGEYGPENSLHDRTSALTAHVIEGLAANYQVKTVEIEHHLTRSGRAPAEIEALYLSCDLVLTSRFHGAVLAMRNEVPFIAIDQIRGGGKLTSLLSVSGWPFVYRIEDARKDEVTRAALDLVGGSKRDLLLEIVGRTKSRAAETLNALEAVLKTRSPAALRPGLRSRLRQVLARWRPG
ncbi:capsular polysaccharide synthesis protein [Mesorhizobium sp. B263B2A]|uniref:capsular polysaccharide synthesis protein n=1 Tax=Mesorhizobium sp. B263B2A TaxID=2876669 RepID=UPI001CD13953|nr:capsular polysaccharide synthesis protein [Mesorhizobium sp. B263B2A]MCA0029721.1 polysaccharide pyruvyl transferase family protein [Mesorhizobium sp. B263B2A]